MKTISIREQDGNFVKTVTTTIVTEITNPEVEVVNIDESIATKQIEMDELLALKEALETPK